MRGALLAMALENLRRMRARTALTAAGITIGIAALVAMLSFAWGLQRNVASHFRSLGLLRTLHVMPVEALHPPEAAEGDSTAAPDSATAVLDDAALASIAAIDGVALAYPQDTFDARLTWRQTSVPVTAQALPVAFAEHRRLGELLAGRFFASDTLPEVVLSRRLVRRLSADPDSLIDERVVLDTGGRAAIIRGVLDPMLSRTALPPELRRLAEPLMAGLLQYFGRHRIELRVVGVAELRGGFGFRLRDLLLPSGIAAGLDRLSFDDPLELLAQLQRTGPAGYALAVVTVDDASDVPRVRTAIEALGLRVVSFAAQLDEIRRTFLIFDLIFGTVGAIGLLVAMLGIINTMVMSILERRREIGILKSLGAQDAHIRWLFLIESGLIGLLGSGGGLLFGWVISRVASFVARRIMLHQGAPAVDLFFLPWWGALGAIALGLAVSLLAGLYPAGRAARIDPIRALRADG
jgi:putative ABC transport system permease protein